MIVVEEGVITSDNETTPRVRKLEYFRAEGLQSSLYFTSVGDQGFAIEEGVGRAKQKNAATDQQNYSERECRPGHTSE